MVKEKELEASKSPVSSHTQAISSQNNINSQVNDTQVPTNRAMYDLLSGSNIDLGQDRDAGILYRQPTSAMDGASHGQADIPPLGAASRARPQDLIDDETLSRAKMWDPVKDCTTKNPHFCHGDHPYGQGQDHRQHFKTLETTGTASMSLLPCPPPHPMASGYPGSAFMGLLPYPQPRAMASRYEGSALMASQALPSGHSYDQFQRSGQHQSGHEKFSTLPPQLRESSGQNRQQHLESITRDTASMGLRRHQAGHVHASTQENRQQLMALKPWMPAPMSFHESSHPLHSSPLTSPSSSTHGPTSELITSAEVDCEQASRLQHQNPSISMSQAFGMARYAESLDHQSNFQEAVHAYEQACVMFQEVIMRSYNIKERMDCNSARNAYQARLNVLLQEPAASQRNPASAQDDQHEDDSSGRGKPQYSLFEDWALCHKEEEDLSWQEVAETPTFKGKRKHRSLSQRKHTIGKMGPKYHEAEMPWTVEDDMKLRALGDAGKTLGDIHRKFRSRNAERCLNRYFSLTGYGNTGRGHTYTSLHAGQAPTQNYQIPPVSGQDIPSASTPRHQTPGMPASSSPQPDAGPTNSTLSKALDSPPSPQAVGNESTDRLLTLRREIPPTSYSPSANKSILLTPNSSRSSSTTLSLPPESHR